MKPLKPFIITTRPSIYEKIADCLFVLALGVAIAFGLLIYLS